MAWSEPRLRGCFTHIVPNAGTCKIQALSQEQCAGELNDLLCSCTLPSSTSVEAVASLFGWFTGTTAQSDFSSTYMSVLWLITFTDRPSQTAEGVLEDLPSFLVHVVFFACAGS